MGSSRPETTCDDDTVAAVSSWLAGMRRSRKVSAESTAGAYVLTECVGPRDCGTPYHVHHGDDELFYVLEGELSFHLRDGSRTIGPGGLIHLPRETPHAFVVESERARFLVLAAPGGHDDFLEKSGTEGDIEILGSPPRAVAPERNGGPADGED